MQNLFNFIDNCNPATGSIIFLLFICLSGAIFYVISEICEIIKNSFSYHKERSEERIALFRVRKALVVGNKEEALAIINEALEGKL